MFIKKRKRIYVYIMSQHGNGHQNVGPYLIELAAPACVLEELSHQCLPTELLGKTILFLPSCLNSEVREGAGGDCALEGKRRQRMV